MSDIRKWYTLERVQHNDKLYFVVFKGKEPKGITDEQIIELRNAAGCDTVLRAKGQLYFCEQITDAEIIEETQNDNTDEEHS